MPGAGYNTGVMKKFKKAGAIGPGKAVAAEELGLRDDQAMDGFVRLGFLAREGNRYYIPEGYVETGRWENWKRLFGGK